MAQRDQADVWRIHNLTAEPHWAWHDFLRAFLCIDTTVRVAEVGGVIVGFLFYRRVRPRNPGPVGTLRSLLRSCLPWPRTRQRRPERIDLLNLAVDPEWRRQGVGRALLRELDRQLTHPGDYVRAVVPETNLSFQLFLRAVGYRAVCILPNHFHTEDAYLMERQAETAEAPPVRPAPSLISDPLTRPSAHKSRCPRT